MAVAVITGSGGLIGSEAARYFAALGLEIVGIENDMRSYFFGSEASTRWQAERLQKQLGRAYRHVNGDVRDEALVSQHFQRYGSDIRLVIHSAAQPSHDWAAKEPSTDFTVNANGTLVLLEAFRKYSPDAVFIFLSTNKVYGDRPNRLPLVELERRYEIETGHPYVDGIPEEMSIDQSLHSLFGVSKAAADLMVQEYGNYFGLQTVCFRGGCLTGPNHSGAELHGFLAYLMKCAVTGRPYTVYGYKGKQVRDNIHSSDLIRAFHEVFRAPAGAQVYNVGGGRASNCSMLEAIAMCQEISGRKLIWEYSDANRRGDHIWWISDMKKFRTQYPNWRLEYGIAETLREIYELNAKRWMEHAS